MAGLPTRLDRQYSKLYRMLLIEPEATTPEVFAKEFHNYIHMRLQFKARYNSDFVPARFVDVLQAREERFEKEEQHG